jgi:predicted phage gp36 major capsid-like protein
MYRNAFSAIWKSPRQRLVQIQNDLNENLRKEQELRKQLKLCRAEIKSNKADIERVTREKHERSHRQVEEGEEESSSEQEEDRRAPSEEDSLSSEDPEQTCPPESDFHSSDEGSQHS